MGGWSPKDLMQQCIHEEDETGNVACCGTLWKRVDLLTASHLLSCAAAQSIPEANICTTNLRHLSSVINQLELTAW